MYELNNTPTILSLCSCPYNQTFGVCFTIICFLKPKKFNVSRMAIITLRQSKQISTSISNFRQLPLKSNKNIGHYALLPRTNLNNFAYFQGVREPQFKNNGLSGTEIQSICATSRNGMSTISGVQYITGLLS
jgi:hypothetical protein